MKKICEITAEGLPAIEEVTNLAEGVCPVCQAARIARKAHGAICGHGTFCRDGMYQLYLIPEDISNGRGSVEDLDLLKDCCELIIKANECELSVRTAELIKASLETHYDEWYDHLTRKRCKAMECPACYTLYIDPALCNGCGKCLGAAPENAVVGGEGMIHVIKKDLLAMKEKEVRKIRGKKISMIFQEPMTSMNPVMQVGKQVEESLRVHAKLSPAQRKERALESLAQVELPNPSEIYRKYPHQLSGGQLQRIMIAAAIVSRPKLLLADEPTTALDVTVQAQILALLKKINRESGMGILFISHDLHVVRKLCTRVAVMEQGKLVELDTVDAIYQRPAHPYTKKLISAIPHREGN